MVADGLVVAPDVVAQRADFFRGSLRVRPGPRFGGIAHARLIKQRFVVKQHAGGEAGGHRVEFSVVGNRRDGTGGIVGCVDAQSAQVGRLAAQHVAEEVFHVHFEHVGGVATGNFGRQRGKVVGVAGQLHVDFDARVLAFKHGDHAFEGFFLRAGGGEAGIRQGNIFGRGNADDGQQHSDGEHQSQQFFHGMILLTIMGFIANALRVMLQGLFQAAQRYAGVHFALG
mgnify:CR=1 FL=1